MSTQTGIRILALASVLTVNLSFAADGPPAWAYGFPEPGAPAAPAGGAGRGGQAAPDTSPKHLAGSSLEFTLAQIRDSFGPADWYPGDHPKMPDIVAHGTPPRGSRLRLCHYPNGKGRAENAAIAGLPGGLLHPADERFQERQPQERRAAEGQHQRHDHVRQGHDRRRDQGMPPSTSAR